MIPKRSKIGNNWIQTKRIEWGYKQEEFAQILGIPRSTLSLIEINRREISYSALKKVIEMEKERNAAKE